MNGAVAFVVFIWVMMAAYVIAGYGYARGWWWDDRCRNCRHQHCQECGRHGR